MNRRRRSIAGRDQRASTFGAALMRLCDAVSAMGAALVDPEGETVDYAGSIDPFEIRVAAAEWVIILALLKGSRFPSWPESEQLVLRGSKKSFLVQLLGDGYAIVLELLPHAFGVSNRALAEAVRDLCAEAGLELPPSQRRAREHWWRVDVRCDPKDPKRPSAVWVSGAWCRAEILGRFRAEPRTRGYRVRLPSGAEIALVREPLGRWYMDAHPSG